MASLPPPHVVEDVPTCLQILSDGTVIRFDHYPLPLPTPPPNQPVVEWKDVVYDASHDLCKLRVYKPQAAAASSSSAGKKLPVIVYYHGGGYIMGSFAMPNFHACCLRLAGELPAVVLSADYRLAPEDPLPAGLDDAAKVLRWVRDQAVADDAADPWLSELADFRQVFVAGDSAGGGVVHHTAVRLASGLVGRLDPVRVVGHIILFPLFGGVERTASELELPPGPFVSLPVTDKGWRILLPPGSTRDHPFANPFGPESPAMDGLALPPILMVVAEYDLLRDRAVDYVARLKAMGKSIELAEFEKQDHGFFSIEPYGDAGSEVVRLIKRFVDDNAAAST